VPKADLLGITVVWLAAACGGSGTGQTGAAGDWTLVWSDEFSVDGLPDPSRWTYDVGGHGWGNQELQDYRASRLENARVEDGRLIVEARREPSGGREYSSARLLSRENWTYGRVEVRAKLPSGRGTWPAVWMLPGEKAYGGWPASGEIDIMEHVGHDPDRVHASIHTAAYNHVARTQKTANVRVESARREFNVYALEWSAEEIRVSVNGEAYFTFRNERLGNPQADHRQWPFDRGFHLILNLAVGGTWGGAEGVDTTIWPQRLEVDYVRVYRGSAPSPSAMR
jgi:beta-glucanase (GH16 family)